MLKYIEGFELVTDQTGLAYKGYAFNNYGNKSILVGTGRNNGNSLSLASVYDAISSSVGYPWFYTSLPNLSSGVIGFAFYSNTSLDSNYRVFFGLYDTNGYVQFWLARKGNYIYLFQPTSSYSCQLNTVNTTGTISTIYDVVWNNNISWSPIADSSTSGFTIDENAWYYMEIKYQLGVSGGVAVNCNSAQILNYSSGSYNFSPSGTGFIYSNVANKFGLGYSQLSYSDAFGESLSNQYNLFDDIYVVDLTGTKNNTFLGNVAITKMQPNSDFSTTMIPNGAASDYLCVNDPNPNGDASYVLATTTDLIDLYGLTAYSPIGVNILGVAVNICALQKSGTGSYQPAFENSSINYYGGSTVLNGDYQTYEQVFETKPNDNSSWTTSDLNSWKFGMKYTTP